MAFTKLLNLLAVSCLATIIFSLGPAPALALSVDTTYHARHNLHHAADEKEKRATPTSAPEPTSGGFTSDGSFNSEDSAKVGIAWFLGNDPAIENFKTAKVDKYHTLSPFCLDFANQVGLNCCPMLWGDKQIIDFSNLVKPGYAQYALGFNEPNQVGQSDMSPQHGADLWLQYLNPLKDQGYFLVSPSCTNAPSGKQWIKDFLSSCGGCQVDAIGLHWFGTDPQDFVDYITDMHLTFNKPIWVTEFGCQDFSGGAGCGSDQVFDFMRDVTAFMDNASFVQEYFAFGFVRVPGETSPTQLIDDNGEPTDLGRLYIGEA